MTSPGSKNRARNASSRTERNMSPRPLDNTKSLKERLAEVAIRTWDLGFITFGGLPVHFRILRRRFVDGEGHAGVKWIDEQTYQELFAICQALPGPASTKMLFCIVMIHAGFAAALSSFFLWTLPGAIGMYALSLGVQQMPAQLPSIAYAMLTGMNASITGIIALAAVQLAGQTIKDRITRVLVIFGACAGLCYNALWYFPVLIAIGGIATVTWDLWLSRSIGKLRARYVARRRRAKNEDGDAEETSATQTVSRVEQFELQRPAAAQRRPRAGSSAERILPDAREMDSSHSTQIRHSSIAAEATPDVDVQEYNISVKLGLGLIVGFFISFLVVIITHATVPTHSLVYDLFATMYLAGTIIFGGGPVVIPLLRSYFVDPGWVSPRDFLLGLAIIQAFPGPNFNFSVYLGAITFASIKIPTIFGALLAFFGIYIPGMILALGLMSVWQVLRTKAWILSLLRGINAAAVGLVFTAVYRLWEIGYLTPSSGDGKSLAQEPWWVVVAAVTYAETAWFGVPPALAIIFGTVLGLGWYGAVGSRSLHA